MVTVLASLSHARAFRSIGPTLDELLRRGHRVVVHLELPDRHAADGGAARAKAWAAARAGASVQLPGSRRWGRGRLAAGLRAGIDHGRHQPGRGTDLGPPTSMANRAAAWVPRWYHAAHRRLGTGGRRRLTAALALADHAIAPRRPAAAAIAAAGADVVLVSPLVLPGSRQAEVVRAAKAAAVPTCLVVESWDNLSTKGTLHCEPDRVVVWNQAQVVEAVTQHGVAVDRTVVSGASSLDDWTGFDAPVEDADAQLLAAGLDPGRPWVLYLGSSPTIVVDEGALLLAWLDAVAAGPDAAPQVLVRPHPRNPLPSAVVAEVGRRPGVAVLSPGEAAADVDRAAWRAYGATLQHCWAAVGVNSTALLEAALFGRPVLAVPDPLWDRRQEPPHHHHLRDGCGPLLQGGESIDAQRRALAAAIAAGPDRPDPVSVAFAARFLRPLGPRARGAPVVADVVEALAAAAPVGPTRVGA